MISNPLKTRLIQAIIWPIVTYGADAWTLNKELTGNIEAFEMQCYRRSMKVPYTEHVTNETILRRVQRERGLLANVKSHKLKHFGHTARHNSPLRSYWAQCRKKTPGRPDETVVRRPYRVDGSYHPGPGVPGARQSNVS